MYNFLMQFTLASTTGDVAFMFLAMMITCLASGFGLFYFIRHGRIMQDTPTSKIRSASQGFVEIEGRARSLDNTPLRAGGTGTECVWFDYLVEERNGREWSTISHDVSNYSFYVDDGTGLCAVDPDLGKIIFRHKKVWINNDIRYTEKLIAEGEQIYCLGQFETEQGASRNEVIRLGVRALLNQWKTDRAALLRRFDVNGDGDIDMDEWNQARAAAQVKVKTEVDADYQQTQHHNLVKPFNKNHPYIISSFSQDELTNNYKWYAFGLLSLCLTSGAYAVFLTIVRSEVFPMF